MVNKPIGSICCGKIDKSDEDLWWMSGFVGAFGFGGNFEGMLLFLLNALLELLILSVMLMVEWNLIMLQTHLMWDIFN